MRKEKALKRLTSSNAAVSAVTSRPGMVPGRAMGTALRTVLRFACGLAAALLLAVPHAVAAGQQDILRKTQEAYASMQTFRAEFTQKLSQKETGTTQQRTGSIIFKKPLLVRWETAAPNAELLLVNDREIWNYLPDEELAYRYSRSLADDSRSIIQVITGQSPLDRDFEVQDMAQEDKLLRLTLYPKEASTEMTEVRLWLEPSSGLMRRAVIVDFYGNTNDIQLVKIQPGAPVSEADFRFSPPAGVEVEDHIDRPHPRQTRLSE